MNSLEQVKGLIKEEIQVCCIKGRISDRRTDSKRCIRISKR